MIYARRLIACGLNNARDLGGYSTIDGKFTRFGCFVRSEIPQKMTVDHIEFLKKYGIRTVMDFRGGEEKKWLKSSLEDQNWLEHLVSPLQDNKEIELARKIAIKYNNAAWGDIYIMTLQNNKKWIQRSMIIAAVCEGGLLFHCTTGKDRTGIISALLLGLAKVPNEDIITDYMCSQVYLKQTYENIFKESFDSYLYKNNFYNTNPNSMKVFLDYIKDHYGDAEGYLKAIGLTGHLLNQIKEKFVTDNQ